MAGPDGRKYIVGFIELDAENRATFMEMAKGYVAACRAEDDCLFFNLVPDHERADRVILVECFPSEEAHQRHLKTEHFTTIAPQMFALCRSAHFENVIAQSVGVDDPVFNAG